MATFTSFDGVNLSYSEEGDGATVVLLHGFAADTNVNYVRAGLLDALLDEGYRVITLDARGHGLSEKPTDPGAYADDAMRRDVQALFDRLGIVQALVVGYSMGGHTALRLAAADPRVKALVLLGVGERGDDAQDDGEGAARMIDALESGDADALEHAEMRNIRIMAGLDTAPLVAYLRAGRPDDHEGIDDVKVPAIVIVGEDDRAATDAPRLAERLGAPLVTVPGDHFTSNARPELHRALLAFVAEHT
jgi:pimeloyl-ACP methyl ester carboxylesterase